MRPQYMQWLGQLNTAIEQSSEQQLKNLFSCSETMKAYLKAGRDLSAYETHLFIETFIRQRQELIRPAIWPETLWQALSAITDQTQVAWQELEQELTSQGLHQADEIAGMGVYCCRICAEEQHIHHPAPLLPCACGGVTFIRRGLPV